MFVILRYQVCGCLSQQPLETNTCSGYVAKKDEEGIKKKNYSQSNHKISYAKPLKIVN